MQSYGGRFRYKASRPGRPEPPQGHGADGKILPAADSEFSFPRFREPRPADAPYRHGEPQRGWRQVILEDQTGNLVPGSRIGLLGRNGAGKSPAIEDAGGQQSAAVRSKLEVSAGVSISYFASTSSRPAPERLPARSPGAPRPDKTEQELRQLPRQLRLSTATRCSTRWPLLRRREGAPGAGPHHLAEAQPAAAG